MEMFNGEYDCLSQCLCTSQLPFDCLISLSPSATQASDLAINCVVGPVNPVRYWSPVQIATKFHDQGGKFAIQQVVLSMAEDPLTVISSLQRVERW